MVSLGILILISHYRFWATNVHGGLQSSGIQVPAPRNLQSATGEKTGGGETGKSKQKKFICFSCVQSSVSIQGKG